MAVISWTGINFLAKMYQKQGFALILFFVLCRVATSHDSRSCESARKAIEDKLKVQSIKIPDVPQTGDLCGQSCCTKEVERDAYKFNQLFVDKYIKNSVSKISSIIETRARKFDDQFQGMMKTSKKEFHDMFERTYGKIYLKNSDVFSDFFDELETYYKKGSVRLSETMDTFFGILYQRMFTVINAQYTFDEGYLDCVSSHMQEMKPFGDVPHKLGVQLRRSFVATRTFFKSLMKAAEAADRLGELKVGEECYRESAKMRYCGICKGEDGGVPCSPYCISTMQNCLKYHTEVSSYWDNLIDAIDKVGDRLLGPYNIEIVVEPLNIKISEAIMNFQESGTEVSKRIYSLCGKPNFSRPKRQADYPDASQEGPTTEIKIEPMKIPGRKKHKKTMAPVENTSSPLEKIITDIKQKIKETKQFWQNLPYQYCNNLSILNSINSTSSQCWNGTYINNTITQSKINLGDHPILNEQTYALQGLTEKLRKAHQGQEVEMVDDTEEILDGSGSGSGDGLEEEEEGETTVKDDKELTFEEPNKEEDEVHNRAFPISTSSSTRAPEVVTASSANTNTNNMSLTRALITYLLPMIMAWFGGAITNLL
ncbi:glypican-6 isoform X1 [Diabrotica virgifera virgifera]|uniref:Glypican-6 n=1 Tax=Diabrotica virgifera virgifera TaxID=50390 RepID=A0ABM5KX32_DIAVI|nr:glypican-6 isoform X1 [Diabrotica virgifera virgifera]